MRMLALVVAMFLTMVDVNAQSRADYEDYKIGLDGEICDWEDHSDTCVGCTDDCLEPAVSCEEFMPDDPDYCDDKGQTRTEEWIEKRNSYPAHCHIYGCSVLPLEREDARGSSPWESGSSDIPLGSSDNK